MAFDYSFPFQETDPNCQAKFSRSFVHRDWVDAQDVVQAQATAEEEGFNLRFHKLEADIDHMSDDVKQAFASIRQLRTELFLLLQDIKTELNRPPEKTSKEFKDGKDTKDGKDAKDGKDTKDAKDGKDGKDTKDAKDGKDGKDSKDGKDTKETKDHKDGKEGKDGKELAAKEKDRDQIPAPFGDSLFTFLFDEQPGTKGEAPAGRCFIRPDERPPVGQRAVDEALRDHPQ